jgi:hypothetical protein
MILFAIEFFNLNLQKLGNILISYKGNIILLTLNEYHLDTFSKSLKIISTRFR